MNPPLRCCAEDMAVWESHVLCNGVDYYGLVVICDHLADPSNLYVDASGDPKLGYDPTPAWHTRPPHYVNGHEIVWVDRFLRPIRPAADPRAAENKRILEQQIDRQTATGVIAC